MQLDCNMDQNSPKMKLLVCMLLLAALPHLAMATDPGVRRLMSKGEGLRMAQAEPVVVIHTPKGQTWLLPEGKRFWY